MCSIYMKVSFNPKYWLIILICLSFVVICIVNRKPFLSNLFTSKDITDNISVVTLESLNTISGYQSCGDSIGSFNGVTASYNSGGINSCGDRNWSVDNTYSYGFRWQCVEFVRRYYYEALGHKMPNRWGNACNYFRQDISSGSMNMERGLVQYHNGSVRPIVNDLLVFQDMAGGLGHVSIVIAVTDSTVSTIAQNIGRECMSVLSLDGDQVRGGCSGLLRLPITLR